jgi:glycosyltransferase involved in cell wall biosynthesis
VKISYAITVCNELDEIKKLLKFLLQNKRDEDEVVITWDSHNGSSEVKDFLFNHEEDFRLLPFNFLGDFSALKNHTKESCKGDYIFHIDADEIPHETLIEQLPIILEMNDVDLVWIPRVNTVEGLTDEWTRKWGWRVSEKGWVNYPDYQSRVFRNSDNIEWRKKVHEQIDGCKTYAHLPPQEELSLYHFKTIEKQIKQNELYENYR